jgi:uncharacterized protein with von Willebrand factor type A (vWA) domain
LAVETDDGGGRRGFLRGIDRAALAVAMTQRLRGAGVAVDLTAAGSFVQALAALPPDSRSRLYWTARISLVRKQSDLAAFDAVFGAVFDDATLAVDPHARRMPLGRTDVQDDTLAAGRTASRTAPLDAGSGLPWLTLPPVVGESEDSDSAASVPQLLPSELSGLAEQPFEELSAAEMDQLSRWLGSALRQWPTRRSRRFAVDRAGHRVAIRPTIARSRHTGWEPIELVRVSAVDKPRRVVMLCDMSQSMQAQATAYLHLMRALASGCDAEVFAFATTLTRLTTVLTHRSAEVAITQATEKVADRFGGTRIASNIQSLLGSYHGGSVRGAIVIVASDGWDSDSPEQLAGAMARLRRRAYRVIWINPRAAAPGFEPRVSTMAAALPYCDKLLPADNFRSLARVVAEISRCAATPRPGAASRASSTGSRRSTV